jgi:transposase InsO family protein
VRGRDALGLRDRKTARSSTSASSALAGPDSQPRFLLSRIRLNSDRGCQYTSAQLARFAREHNLARSVGRTGVCWDNAQQESFWATLKVEFYDRYLWPTKAAAKLAVGDWIERVYNRRRRHSSLGMICPVEFENRLTQTAQAA